MRRAFTLIEIVTCIAIVLIVAAIATPVFLSSKNEAKVTHCIERLRQTGLAVALYREEYGGGSPVGYAWEMALPVGDGWDVIHRAVRMECPEVDLRVGKVGDSLFAGDIPGASSTETWPKWVAANGEATVLLGDPNHNPNRWFGNPNFAHLGLGLALDTSVRRIRRKGDPFQTAWWQKNLIGKNP